MNCTKHGGNASADSKTECYSCWLVDNAATKVANKPSKDEFMLNKYNSGARFVLIPQSFHIDDMVFYEKVLDSFKAPWASGLYQLCFDGSLGNCLSYNYDSSD